MEYEIKFTGNTEDLIELANHKRAYEALRKIHSLCRDLSRYAEDDETEHDLDELIEEVKACMHEVICWTQVDGVF
jgi:hypothetical protein